MKQTTKFIAAFLAIIALAFAGFSAIQAQDGANDKPGTEETEKPKGKGKDKAKGEEENGGGVVPERPAEE